MKKLFIQFRKATEPQGEQQGQTPGNNVDGGNAEQSGANDEATKARQHTVTQADLDANPSLAEQGVVVGDEIELGELAVQTDKKTGGIKGAQTTGFESSASVGPRRKK